MKPGMKWPIGIAAILGTSVVGNLVMMRVANSDPSFAVEDDYYQRAVDFDSTMQRDKRSAALGWHSRVSIDSVRAGVGVLQIVLQDSRGQAIQADSVVAVAFFNARSNERTRLVLSHGSADPLGVYTGSIEVTHAGQWEVQVEAMHGTSDHFQSSTRVDVAGENPKRPDQR